MWACVCFCLHLRVQALVRVCVCVLLNHALMSILTLHSLCTGGHYWLGCQVGQYEGFGEEQCNKLPGAAEGNSG